MYSVSLVGICSGDALLLSGKGIMARSWYFQPSLSSHLKTSLTPSPSPTGKQTCASVSSASEVYCTGYETGSSSGRCGKSSSSSTARPRELGQQRYSCGSSGVIWRK